MTKVVLGGLEVSVQHHTFWRDLFCCKTAWFSIGLGELFNLLSAFYIGVGALCISWVGGYCMKYITNRSKTAARQLDTDLYKHSIMTCSSSSKLVLDVKCVFLHNKNHLLHWNIFPVPSKIPNVWSIHWKM